MLIFQDNLTIRNATVEDAKLLCNWWNDGNVMAHAGFPNGLGTDPQSVIDDISKDTDETFRRLIIEVESVPVGEMSYRNVGNNTAEIGIKICDFKRQERGFGTQFLKMLIQELFNRGYDRIVLDTNLKNKREQYVYEKLGFRKVGVRTNSWVDQLGMPQTSVDYELKKSQYQA